MRKLLLKSLLPALLMILCGFGSAKAETFIINGNSEGVPSTASNEASEITVGDAKFSGVQIKSYSSKDTEDGSDALHGGKTDGKTIIFTKGSGWIASTSKFSSITSVRVKSGSGGSTKNTAKYGIAISSDPFTTKPTSGFAATGYPAAQNTVYDTNVTGTNCYIAIVSTGSTNVQLSIEITGTLADEAPDNRTDVNMSWSASTCEATIDASDNVFPTLTVSPAVSPITYTSTNESVATIDSNGTITLVAAGETTIKAAYAGDTENYKPAQAQYTLTVHPAAQVIDPNSTPVQFIFNTVEGLAELGITAPETGTEKVTEPFVKGVVNIANTNGGNNETAIGISDGALTLRLYQDNTLTITVPTSYVITNVVSDATDKKDNAVDVIWTINDNTATFTPSAQVRFLTITVYYKPAPVELTVSDVKYSTLYYSDRALVVPEGLAAYTFAYNAAKNEVTAAPTYDAGKVIPAGVAVVLYGNAGDYTFALADEAGTAPDENILKGTDEAVTVTAEGTPYVLSVYDNTVGFYWAAADGGQTFTNKAHKAYLDLPSSANGAPAKIILDFGNTDGINCIVVDQDEAEGSMYNVLGQPVNNNYRGFVIRNGKKAINK